MKEWIGARVNSLPRAFLSCVVGAVLCWSATRPYTANGQPAADAFVKWASARAIPLRTVEPEEDSEDLLPLKPVIGPARVVILGEPNHGTHEPLALRNRLIRFFIEKMGFTAVALETGFTESYSLEQFVATGSGQPRSTVHDAMSWGFGNFPENEELNQWIREYNGATTHHTKIRIYGIE